MRKEKIRCCDCGELIDITKHVDDYYEVDQEQPIVILECDKCETKNTIFWQATVEFGSWRTTSEDEELFN
jgi:hypothetical protein